jgi:dipeptidyl aminopeptidase/acylaminoacyl peptidase
MGIVSQARMASLFAVMLAVGYESGVHADAVTGPSIVSPPVRFLTTGARDFWQCFSPDGTEILFSPHTLELSPGQGRAPAWSPSGEQLLFESDRASSAGLYAIFLIKRDGTGITQLTDPALNADHPVWSPDGQHIAFSAHDTTQLGAVRSIGIITWPETGAARR